MRFHAISRFIMHKLNTTMKCIAFCFFSFIALLACADESAKLRVMVLDDNDKALPGAKLCIHLWTGQWERTQVSGVSDQQGRAELAGVKTETYLTVSAEADGWASTAFDMELAAKEERELTVRLRRPASGRCEFKTNKANRFKVPYCRFSIFAAGDGGSLFYRPAGNEPFPFEPTASDAQGVIKLPAMPIPPKWN